MCVGLTRPPLLYLPPSPLFPVQLELMLLVTSWVFVVVVMVFEKIKN